MECSENIIPLTLEQKIKCIKVAKDAGLKVMFEVGDKYPDTAFDVNMASDEMLTMFDNGCDLCILKRSQIELCLGPSATNPQASLLVDLAGRVGLEKLVFEAEAEAQAHQVWLFRTFGPDVNLGPNLDKDAIPKLEPTRRTLSREGGYDYLLDRVAQMEGRAVA